MGAVLVVSMWVLAGLATATVSRNLFEEPVLPSTASMNVLLQHVNIPGDLVPLPASDFPLTTSATWRRQSSTKGFPAKLVRISPQQVMSKPPDLILNDVLGANLSVTAVHRADVPAPHYVWIGEVSDQPFISFVALVIREDKVHGNFHVYDSSSRGKRYFLVIPVSFSSKLLGLDDTAEASTGNGGLRHQPGMTTANPMHYIAGLHAIIEHAGDARRPAAAPVPVQPVNNQKIISKVAEQVKSRAMENHVSQAEKAEVTLLVLATQAAIDQAGGFDALSSQADAAVALTNKAYVDSDVNMLLTKVNYTEPNDTSRTCSYDNPWCTSSDIIIWNDFMAGRVPEALVLRDEYAADLITLFNNDTTVCGRGAVGFSGSYQEWPLVANANAWGYSLVMSGCWRGPALAHEIGHNMGGMHTFERDYDEWQRRVGSYPPYAHGISRCDLGEQNFHTIMGGFECPGPYPAAEAYIYSNPSKTYHGVPAGDAMKANMARRLNEVAAEVAAFRTVSHTCAMGQYWCEDMGQCIGDGYCCRNGQGPARCLQEFYHCQVSGRPCACYGNITECGGQCPAGYKQCDDSCIFESSCCWKLDDCPFGFSCQAWDGPCEPDCSLGEKRCGIGDGYICTSPSRCCTQPDDCPEGYECPVDGGRCKVKNTRCNAGERTCQVNGQTQCIPSAACCTNSDCLPGQYCRNVGEPCKDVCENRKWCGGRLCVPADSCCPGQFDDCPEGQYCPRVGKCQPRCPRTQRQCGDTCVRKSQCCGNKDCPAGALCKKISTNNGGVCMCPKGKKVCKKMNMCIPRNTTCT